jgi:hypothetical protein
MTPGWEEGRAAVRAVAVAARRSEEAAVPRLAAERAMEE